MPLLRFRKIFSKEVINIKRKEKEEKGKDKKPPYKNRNMLKRKGQKRYIKK